MGTGPRYQDTGRQGDVSDDGRVRRIRTGDPWRTSACRACAGHGRGQTLTITDRGTVMLFVHGSGESPAGDSPVPPSIFFGASTILGSRIVLSIAAVAG